MVASGTSKKGGNCWSRVHGKINHVADNFFYRLGYWVATHPKATLTISLALVIACCFGFANFEVESDGKSWDITAMFFTCFVLFSPVHSTSRGGATRPTFTDSS